jgi:TFIIF-interacting CTD phosphatase-like protein
MDKTLVLDLDSTLILSVFGKKEVSYLKDIVSNHHNLTDRIFFRTLLYGPEAILQGMECADEFAVISRPHLRIFIEYIRNNFEHVHIWSAGKFRYVRAIENIIFPIDTIGIQLSFDDCVFGERGFTLKELAVKGFDLTKTIVIDDRDDTFSENQNNALHVSRFDMPNSNVTKNISLDENLVSEICKDDQTLLRIIDWFKNSGVLTCSDVRTIPKPNLFI